MRKAFSLVELLAVIAIFPVVALSLDRMFKAVVIDIPKSSYVVEENTTVLDILDHIRSDIDRAKGLPRTFGDYTAGDDVLLIKLPDTTICYQLKDEKVIRHNLGKEPTSSAWVAPNADIKWKVWEKDNVGYAVEIATHIEHKRARKQTERMAGAHLYFVGAL
ncbi:MAG: PulJ/GspJ family protein [Planctomycetota bacterium]|jgi:prepilin-type N-terminal cleavage/methylation domain-containing protein